MIEAGDTATFSVGNGGAVEPVAGFRGYVIAECAFQHARGVAFVTDIGVQKLAMSYLGLVLER